MMTPETALIASTAITLIGTLAGTFGGIMTSSKLTNYRIEQLERKVDKHNCLIERTYALEKQQAVLEEKIKEVMANDNE